MIYLFICAAFAVGFGSGRLMAVHEEHEEVAELLKALDLRAKELDEKELALEKFEASLKVKEVKVSNQDIKRRTEGVRYTKK